jgi:TatD DNase family protein
MYRLVDTHAHLEEIPDLASALAAARVAGVAAIVAVGSDAASNARILDIARRYPGFVYPAFGLHPNNLSPGGLTDAMGFIAAHAGDAVAIGEVGLDYHRRALAVASKEHQQAALRDLLQIARRHHKPVLIHSRYAWRDALDIVTASPPDQAVFHWFTGPSSVLQDIVNRGYYLSATPAAAYHEEHRRAVRETPLDHLLLETDSPVTYRLDTDSSFQSLPADVRRSLTAASSLHGLTEEAVAAATTANAVKLFRLPLQ